VTVRNRIIGYGVMTHRVAAFSGPRPMHFSAGTADREQGSYGSPGGSDTRRPRTMIDSLMRFSLESEADSLRLEPEYRDGDRNSRTLAKETDLRVMLTVLREGAALDEQDGDARATVQVIDGTATLQIEDAEAHLEPAEIAVVDRGEPWVLRADSDCALLLTIAWPPEKARV
jgi:quercetin dioxygenase-like cupin family protein